MDLRQHSFSAESDLIQEMVERCDALSVPCSPQLEVSREVATSLWQKAIRRGQTLGALRALETLLELDAEYVWRRMRVIALEDVSIGSLPVVARVLAVAGKKTIRRKIGEKRLARFITWELATATKSRTACDLLSWMAAVPCAESYRNGVKDSISNHIAHLPTSDEAWKIAAIVQLIAGHTDRRDGRYILVSKPSASLRTKFLDALGTTGFARYIADRGSGTYGLNLLLPFVQSMIVQKNATEPSTVVHEIEAHEYVGRIEAYAYCIYTPEGRAAFRHFLRRDSDLARALVDAGGSSRTIWRALGILVYQVEGALLDRDIESDWTRSVFLASNDAELANLGLDPATYGTLRRATQTHIPAINDSRRAVVESAQYAAINCKSTNSADDH